MNELLLSIVDKLTAIQQETVDLETQSSLSELVDEIMEQVK